MGEQLGGSGFGRDDGVGDEGQSSVRGEKWLDVENILEVKVVGQRLSDQFEVIVITFYIGIFDFGLGWFCCGVVVFFFLLIRD